MAKLAKKSKSDFTQLSGVSVFISSWLGTEAFEVASRFLESMQRDPTQNLVWSRNFLRLWTHQKDRIKKQQKLNQYERIWIF